MTSRREGSLQSLDASIVPIGSHGIEVVRQKPLADAVKDISEEHWPGIVEPVTHLFSDKSVRHQVAFAPRDVVYLPNSPQGEQRVNCLSELCVLCSSGEDQARAANRSKKCIAAFRFLKIH